MSLDTAVTTNIIATSLMLLTYAYLFMQYRHSYLAKWLGAWIFHVIRIIFLEKPFVEQVSIIPSLLYIGLSFVNSLLMIAGTVEFAGKRLSKWWVIVATIILLFTSVGITINISPALYIFPGVIFVGSVYICTGLVIWNCSIRGVGSLITSSAFVLLGLHAFDMPFLFRVEWFAPWGYLIDGLLRYFVAIGIILVYFEKNKNELEKYYQLLAENTTDVIYRYRLSKPAGFEYISPAVKQLTGYSPDYFQTVRQVMHIIHPEDRAKFKKLLKGNTISNGFITLRARTLHDELIWIEQRYSLIIGSSGHPIAVEGIVRDITKRVLLEQDVSRLDRLNIVGQMAANFAHEVRNPLTTVRGYIQLLGKKSEFSPFKEQFSLLLEELDRTNHIITEYLSLSKNKALKMKRCNFNDIISSLYPLVQADAVTSKVEIELYLETIPQLYVDDKEIKQLILNLTRNAIEAMPSGGKLQIKTTNMGSETVLTVSDQGKGIPQHIMENLGKPFLTTKENGTGLGMAICYRICHRHNAKLEINSGPDGTTINIRFQNS